MKLPDAWKGEQAQPQAVAKLVPDATPAANIPDAPQDIVKCINRPLCTKNVGESKSADDIVADCARTDEERRVCARAALAHWDKVQKANGVKKPATPAPTKKPSKTAEVKKLEP